jgi:GNAT superfamily N-acetyltransferase
MNHSLAIRRCAMPDSPMLSHLAARTFYDTFADTCTEEDMHSFLEQHYHEQQLAGELANPADHYYFAEINSRPVGYLRFGENPVPFPYNKALKPLELNRLYVDVQYHGQSVAKQLMQFFEDYAAANGYTLLWLGVWEFNERAQAFYKKWGYRFNGHKHPFPIGGTPQTDEWWDKVIAP